MTGQLFKRAAVFTDIHFGLKHNSRVHNNDCEEFIHWFIDESKKRNCDICLMLGDWHHHRASVNVSTLNYTMSNLRHLSNNFEHVYIITGNHDLFYREKREIHSMIMGSAIQNLTIVDEPLIRDDVAIVPWLVDDEWKDIKKIKTKYMFGHFEIPGFRMNAQVQMPDHGQISKFHFKHQDYVFSGHFHCRQQEGHIHYIGNPFGHNFADAWDTNRGAMFLEWGAVPEYVDWNDGPKYITCYLTDLLENTEEYLKKKTYARVTTDIKLTFEEAAFIKDICIDSYNIRDLKFIHDQTETDNIEFEGEITFQTVDQIVTEQLINLDMESFDKNKLVEIYQNL